jgi:two-component system, LytTR family, sensor kinase
MGMILRIASSRIVGQGDIVGRSGYFSLNLSANSVMRGRLDARRTLKSLVADLRVDFLLCMLFTYISLGFSYLVFKILPFRTSYVWVIVYASCLLTLNNLVTFGMTSLFNLLWDETGNGLLDELINMKGAYTFAMIATFISSVYANTFYLQSYIRARDEKQALEMALMKEKEIALQSQLNSLKLQINPHFMFNNFNNLLELIEEDTKLAGKFLSNLSKVYRYIITNLDRNLIPVRDEIKFLESYLYLMQVRHVGGVVTNISLELKECKGYLPPAVLQLLVENAIKHNGFSMENPLFIDITLSDDYITVRNLKSPLLSKMESTGLGHKNIIERYSLLCDKKVKIENAENFYSVSLPIIKKTVPMKILILEDEQRNAMRLIRLLNDIDTTFIIEGPLTNIKEAVDFFQSGKTTDLILADIRLTDGLSFEALKYAPATVPIIFTTAYDEYAVQAFKFNSFDYLLKPLDADELEAAIDKATKAGKNYADENLRQLFDSLQKNQFRYRERFLLPYRDGYKTVRVSDINHIETENKTVYLRLNNGTSEVVNMSMDELEQQLNPDCFFRANRQYIINIEYVLFLSNYFGGKLIVRLKGYPNTKITVSKEKAQRLKEWIDK